jgi:hypothetical protein
MSGICVVVLDHGNDRYLQDLVDGAQAFCPAVELCWYNSGPQPPAAGTPGTALPMLPNSRPLRYAKVAPFFLDLFEWAAGRGYAYVVNAETDMAFVQPGYERFVRDVMRDADYLAPGLDRERPGSRGWQPYRGLWRDLPELLALLGLAVPSRCFNPAQVFSARYIDRVLNSPWYGELREFVARDQDAARSLSLEQVLLPSLAEALGLRARGYPCHLVTVNRCHPYHTAESLRRARTVPHAYFVHPVRRAEDDPARAAARALAG